MSKKLVVFAPGLVVSMQTYVPHTAELPRNFPLSLVSHVCARNGLVATSRSFRHCVVGVDLVRIDLVRGDVVGVDLVRGDLARGDVVGVDLVRGDLVRGDVVGVDLVRGDVVRGDVVRGDMVRGMWWELIW